MITDHSGQTMRIGWMRKGWEERLGDLMLAESYAIGRRQLAVERNQKFGGDGAKGRKPVAGD
ncbi:hypothetical protein SAMN04488026_10032 [Aliiruegeria lutimaris]|uniref:Uncharacterized protein n=1 Tax=Aliiruegeria lutimaris TaxID=571298 RepID=A0A1G8KIT4_9RHOB|nr:hypothetical protein SAMN04488026_10032 [Aliiruegeria lutimaris]